MIASAKHHVVADGTEAANSHVGVNLPPTERGVSSNLDIMVNGDLPEKVNWRLSHQVIPDAFGIHTEDSAFCEQSFPLSRFRSQDPAASIISAILLNRIGLIPLKMFSLLGPGGQPGAIDHTAFNSLTLDNFS
jgi:hypothetical protein